MSSTEEVKNPAEIAPEGADNSMSSKQEEEAAKKKYGGMTPKKRPLLSKDHERSYFDSADWALSKQGMDESNIPPDAHSLRPKLWPTLQPTRYHSSLYAPSKGEVGNVATSADTIANK